MNLIKLIYVLLKMELYLYIEGLLEFVMMWNLVSKYGVLLFYDLIVDIEVVYQFEDLQSFLDLYYQGVDVLRDEDDFYQLMMVYLICCYDDNVVYVEIMFDL